MVTLHRLALGLALLLLGPRAHAHGSVQGLGDFMGGFLHPLFEPAHIVALLSLLLLMAQRGMRASNPTLLSLAAATATGLAAATMGFSVPTDTALLVAAALTGLAVVVARPLPQSLHLLLAAGIGLGIGLGSNPESLQGASRYAALAGTWLGACLYPISGATLLEECKRPWVTVLIRVVGSWMVAASVLVLALQAVGPSSTQDGGAVTLPMRR